MASKKEDTASIWNGTIWEGLARHFRKEPVNLPEMEDNLAPILDVIKQLDAEALLVVRSAVIDRMAVLRAHRRRETP